MKISAILTAASVLFLTVSCGSPKGGEEENVEMETPKVSVTQVFAENVPQLGTYTSTVEANAVNNIAPQSALRIKNIKVEIGDFVSAGQVVAEMDVANLEQARLQLANDSTELVRVRGLFEVGGISRSDLDAITLSYNVRKTMYENLLENVYLCSPISGVVTARNYDAGDMYSMSQPIFVVQQITPVKLLVGVSEADYTKVKVGDKMTIVADALPERTFEGIVSRIYPTIDPTTHTFITEVKVVNKDKALRPGMFAKVTVNFGVKRSVVVPDKAVIRQQGSGDRFVYVLNDDGTVSYNKVTLGQRLYDKYEILDGVPDGAKVVIDGQLRIRDGIQVEVVE